MARSTFPLPNTFKPTGAPLALPINFSFDLGGQLVQPGDINLEVMTGQMDFVQSIWIDNSQNANPFTITFGGMQYRIIVKKNHQGTYPVIVPAGPLTFSATTTLAAGLIVPTIMFNVQTPYANWDTV